MLSRAPTDSRLHVAVPISVGFTPDGLARLDDTMRQGLASVFPAAALLVARRGRVVFHRAYGWLDPESRQRPTQLDSLFDLASLTKLFTATAFMMLVEAGKVGVDTAVAHILPQFANPTITFRHLLTHTSGLPAWQNLYENNDATEPLTALYKNLDFASPSGQRFVYSDLGFILLGEAVARLSGMSLAAYLKQAVFDPLGLHDAGFNPLERGVSPESIVPTEFCSWRQRRCVGEVHDENAAGLGGEAGHAGLFATVWNVAALGQVYLNDGRYGDSRLFSLELATKMTREQVDFDGDRRGLGWMLQRRSGNPVGQAFGPNSYGHTGFTGTSLWIDPARELLVVLLTNRVYNGRILHNIVNFRVRLHDTVIAAMEK